MVLKQPIPIMVKMGDPQSIIDIKRGVKRRRKLELFL